MVDDDEVRLKYSDLRKHGGLPTFFFSLYDDDDNNYDNDEDNGDDNDDDNYNQTCGSTEVCQPSSCGGSRWKSATDSLPRR